MADCCSSPLVGSKRRKTSNSAGHEAEEALAASLFEDILSNGAQESQEDSSNPVNEAAKQGKGMFTSCLETIS